MNDVVEIVSLGVTKKVKSMQMFRKPVNIAYQGDRLGICIGSGLDAKSIERGIIASPGMNDVYYYYYKTILLSAFHIKTNIILCIYSC